MEPELFDGPLPIFIEPCLATLRAKVPAGERWVHEIKWDGYRLQIRIEDGNVSVLRAGVTTGPTGSRRSETQRRRCRSDWG